VSVTFKPEFVLLAIFAILYSMTHGTEILMLASFRKTKESDVLAVEKAMHAHADENIMHIYIRAGLSNLCLGRGERKASFSVLRATQDGCAQRAQNSLVYI